MANINPTEQPTDDKYPSLPFTRSDEVQNALKYLERTLTDDSTPTHERIAAARAILDHAHL